MDFNKAAEKAVFLAILSALLKQLSMEQRQDFLMSFVANLENLKNTSSPRELPQAFLDAIDKERIEIFSALTQ